MVAIEVQMLLRNVLVYVESLQNNEELIKFDKIWNVHDLIV